MSSVDVPSPSSDTKERLEKRFKDREDEYFTYEPFYVLIGTFNVNNRTAPTNVLLDEWIHRQIENSRRFPDIIAVGFQEIDTSSGAYIYDDRKKENEWDQIILRTIQYSYKSKDEKNRFQLLNRVRLMGKSTVNFSRSSADLRLSLQGFYSSSMFEQSICPNVPRSLGHPYPRVSWALQGIKEVLAFDFASMKRTCVSSTVISLRAMDKRNEETKIIKRSNLA